NLRVRSKPDVETMPAVAAAIHDAERTLGDRGRVLVRYSGTEPLLRVMVEGEREPAIRKLAGPIVDAARGAIGVRGRPRTSARGAAESEVAARWEGRAACRGRRGRRGRRARTSHRFVVAGRGRVEAAGGHFFVRAARSPAAGSWAVGRPSARAACDVG